MADPDVLAALAKADYAVSQATATATRAAEGAAAAYSALRAAQPASPRIY
jgi:hypothetical protein